MTRAPRGQNLVLLALTMLFIALMVTMTIGLGLRIRQKHEVQTLADAAAYSNAVMTARTFNNMAVTNRLEVSYWVALAADQSLISWTSYAVAMGNATLMAARDARDDCASPTDKQHLKAFADDVRDYLSADLDGARDPRWRTADGAAGGEALGIQGTISTLRGYLAPASSGGGGETLRDKLFEHVQAQQLTQQIVVASQQRDLEIIKDEGTGLASGGAVSMKEIDCDFGGSRDGELSGEDPRQSGLCLRSTWSTNMLAAAMGSRGHRFLTGRTMLPPKVEAALQRIAADHDVSVSSAKNGSAYWSWHEAHGDAPPRGTEAWGDDHGGVEVGAGRCSARQGVDSYVRSTHLLDHTDEHKWEPRYFDSGGGRMLDARADEDHTMGDCTPLCPSVWVRTIGFKPADDESDAWGQPKLVVALRRDLAKKDRVFPWELHFEFPFSAVGSARRWDGRGLQLQSEGGRGLDISHQTAVSTGIVYYHRREHWDEFPNLLNPFWRATLAPMDVDAPERGRTRDLGRALSGRDLEWQRVAYDALIGVGFQGLH